MKPAATSLPLPLPWDGASKAPAPTIDATPRSLGPGRAHADATAAPATRRVAVYFVASPLQYLAARQVAALHEAGARQVLVWYQPGLQSIVRAEHWDAAMYLPWPRFMPLPGPFGRHRRLRDNIRQVAALVGPAEVLHLHSAVFDTEAINYFLHALPRLSGAPTMRARILPDGLINVLRYPLSRPKRLLMRLRGLRGVVAPELRYTHFAGDRIGSDAAFCDRIYVLPGLPHEYPAAKAVVLPALAPPASADVTSTNGERRALVVGQPLVGTGLLTPDDLTLVSQRLRHWLQARGIHHVAYKAHPKDRNAELAAEGDEPVLLDEPLEQWLTGQRFDVVVGVRSTSLLLARQLYGPATEVRAFGWDRVRFKSEAERRSMTQAFSAVGVQIDAGA